MQDLLRCPILCCMNHKPLRPFLLLAVGLLLASCASVPIPQPQPHEPPLFELPDTLLLRLPAAESYRVDANLEQSRGTPEQYLQLWREGLVRGLEHYTSLHFLPADSLPLSAGSNAHQMLLVVDRLELRAAPESRLKRTMRSLSLHRDDYHEWGWVETRFHIENAGGAVSDTLLLISRDPDPYFIGLRADRGGRLMLRAARDLVQDLRRKAPLPAGEDTP